MGRRGIVSGYGTMCSLATVLVTCRVVPRSERTCATMSSAHSHGSGRKLKRRLLGRALTYQRSKYAPCS